MPSRTPTRRQLPLRNGSFFRPVKYYSSYPYFDFSLSKNPRHNRFVQAVASSRLNYNQRSFRWLTLEQRQDVERTGYPSAAATLCRYLEAFACQIVAGNSRALSRTPYSDRCICQNQRSCCICPDKRVATTSWLHIERVDPCASRRQ